MIQSEPLNSVIVYLFLMTAIMRAAKNRFQLEVPDSVRKIPDKYTLQSQRKGFKRYWTAEIEEKLAEIIDAEERRDNALKDTARFVFRKFDEQLVLLFIIIIIIF